MESNAMEKIQEYYQEIHNSLGSNELCQELPKKILKVMQDVLDILPADARIGIRGAGDHTTEMFKLLNMPNKNIVGIFDKVKEIDEILGYPVYLASDFEKIPLDYVIVANFTHRREILQELSDFKGTVVDFYDELEKKGINLRFPFHTYRPDTPQTLGYFYWNYMECSCEKTLREFLQAALEQKNFVMISDVYEENGGAYGKYPILIEVWNKTQNLLHMIANKIQSRKQEDIILFWVDAVSYHELHNMPNIEKISKDGCFFHRAYTTTSYTNATLRAMFRGTLPIDDYPDLEQVIDHTNSPLIQYLEENNYEFKCFAYPGMAICKDYLIPEQQVSNTVIWWHTLQSLFNAKKPCFYMLQFVTESHSPGTYPAQKVFTREMVDNVRTMETENHHSVALEYLDKCLSSYMQLLGNKTFIVLSDHGCHWNDIPAWADARVHTFCFVKGKNICKENIYKLFSYKNFIYLIRWVIDPENNRLESVESNEVFIQDTDYYNPERINSLIRFGVPRQGIAYRGVQTEQYKYIINAIGEEIFCIFKDGKEMQVPLEDNNLRLKLRAQCGTYFLNINKIERFKYSRELYKTIRNAEPESNQIMTEYR